MGRRIDEFVTSGRLIPDSFANEAVEGIIRRNTDAEGIILDGYPRTAGQATHLLNNVDDSFVAINITLQRAVAIEKLLGRHTCTACHGEFNTAHIVRDHFDMPAILPNKATCPLGSNCVPRLEQRDDDVLEVIDHRLAAYDAEVKELLAVLDSSGRLRSFEVHKGVKDVGKLYALMTT